MLVFHVFAKYFSVNIIIISQFLSWNEFYSFYVYRKNIDNLNVYLTIHDLLIMRALCMIMIKPGTVDAVISRLKKRQKAVKQVMIVTGRADICTIIQGSIDEINKTVINFKKIQDIVSTETLIEVEVNLGW